MSDPQTSPITTLQLDEIAIAADILRRGGLVAFATETVYGLGVDATNAAAVERLFTAKGRPSDNPLIVHLAAREAWPLAARELTPAAAALLDAFAPGPLTVVLPKNDSICRQVTAGLDTVGIRIPNSSQALDLLRAAGRPLAAPSANRSGRPSCTTWRSVVEDLDGRIDAVLKGNVSEFGIESTVVDCCGTTPTLLRPGAISLEQLRSVIDVQPYIPSDASDALQAIRSPGMKHAHYQPAAEVRLRDELGEISRLPPPELAHVACAGLSESLPPEAILRQTRLHVGFSSIEQYAHGFYEFLREADRAGARVIYLQRAPELGIGHALRDRQSRAAAGRA